MPIRIVCNAARGRVLAVLVALLAVGEAVILQQYVATLQHSTDLRVELEYARGFTLIAQAQAERCLSRAEAR